MMRMAQCLHFMVVFLGPAGQEFCDDPTENPDSWGYYTMFCLFMQPRTTPSEVCSKVGGEAFPATTDTSAGLGQCSAHSNQDSRRNASPLSVKRLGSNRDPAWASRQGSSCHEPVALGWGASKACVAGRYQNVDALCF